MKIIVIVTPEELKWMELSEDSLEEQIIDRLDKSGTDLSGYDVEIQLNQ